MRIFCQVLREIAVKFDFNNSLSTTLQKSFTYKATGAKLPTKWHKFFATNSKLRNSQHNSIIPIKKNYGFQAIL